MIVNRAQGEEYADVLADINFHYYRQRMHLGYRAALQEPNEVVERAFLIWELEGVRDKLRAAKAKAAQQ